MIFKTFKVGENNISKSIGFVLFVIILPASPSVFPMQLRPRQKANGSLAPNWLKNVYVVDITQIRYNTKGNKKCLAHAQRLPPQCVTLIFVNHLKLFP